MANAHMLSIDLAKRSFQVCATDRAGSGWDTASNGKGRIRPLRGQYNGQIEVIQWQDLVNDAWMRNRATLHAAGLSRKRPTGLQPLPADPEPDYEKLLDGIDPAE